MNEIKAFNSLEFGEVRTAVYNSEPVFCLADVCRVLDIANSGNVKNRLSEKGICTMDTLTSGGMQKMIFITESNLYKVIFQSRKPEAEKFSDWVTDEVLPTIRKTGGYVNNDELFIDTYLPYADESTKLIFAQTLKTVREQNETIKQQKAEIMHKEDVIIGLVEDIDLSTKRQRITQIVRYGASGNYQDRYSLLYTEFERKYHCNLKLRMESCTIKPKIKNKMDYIDRQMNMIPQLYEIACKLFENDVEKLKAEWDNIIS